MALIGLKYPVAAVVEEYTPGQIPSGLRGFVIGKAITAEKDIKFADNPLYADDSIAEDEKSFESGTLKFGVDEIALETQAKMFGHAYTPASDGQPEKIVKGGSDIIPYLAVGYYKARVKSGVKRYEVTITYKVKFAPPKESAKTKEKSISWGTMETEGTIECLEGFEKDIYEEVSNHATEAAAREYLETYFGIRQSAPPSSEQAPAGDENE